MIPLSELSCGESGVAEEIQLDLYTAKRLAVMGITKGTLISKIRNAPLGDPSQYRIMGYNLSLRRCEAQKIQVVKESE